MNILSSIEASRQQGITFAKFFSSALKGSATLTHVFTGFYLVAVAMASSRSGMSREEEKAAALSLFSTILDQAWEQDDRIKGRADEVR